MPTSSLARFDFPVLIADIGGTNARFAVVEADGAPFRDLGRTPTAGHADPVAAIRDFALPRAGLAPRSAVLAVAGAIEGERIPFTNCPWVLEPRALVDAFGLDTVVVVNDFEAQALALPSLADGDLVSLGGGPRRPDATMAVVGPGTGLGVGLLVRARDLWVPVPGEGGHIDFTPRGPREEAIVHEVARGLARETDEHGVARDGDRVAAEDVLCGRGLVRVHAAVLALDGAEPRAMTPAEVSAAAHAGEPAAVETMAVFARGLGRVCGDVALLSMAHGGVFVAGGIPPKNLDFLADGAFRASFDDKWPYRTKLMPGFATSVVVHPLPAFVGLAAFARDPARYAVPLDGRMWTKTGR